MVTGFGKGIRRTKFNGKIKMGCLLQVFITELYSLFYNYVIINFLPLRLDVFRLASYIYTIVLEN